MKQLFTFALIIASGTLFAQTTNFIFKVGATSVNVAEGDNGITYFFALFSDTLNFEANDIDSLDVEVISGLDYNNIATFSNYHIFKLTL